jgi:SAM-dependent methyltransferase
MSERFQADWLALREPADHRARALSLVHRLQAWSGRRPLNILDLGAGTGSNLRFLAPLLPVGQHWTLVDHDAALLARVTTSVAGVAWRGIQADLAEWPRFTADPAPDLVSASALLDLVPAAWLDSLVEVCRTSEAACLMALSYDGSSAWSAADPDDAAVLAAVNAHQERDKGLGAALGPRAPEQLARRFRAAGFAVWVEPSRGISAPRRMHWRRPWSMAGWQLPVSSCPRPVPASAAGARAAARTCGPGAPGCGLATGISWRFPDRPGERQAEGPAAARRQRGPAAGPVPGL